MKKEQHTCEFCSNFGKPFCARNMNSGVSRAVIDLTNSCNRYSSKKEDKDKC